MKIRVLKKLIKKADTDENLSKKNLLKKKELKKLIFSIQKLFHFFINW